MFLRLRASPLFVWLVNFLHGCLRLPRLIALCLFIRLVALQETLFPEGFEKHIWLNLYHGTECPSQNQRSGGFERLNYAR
jgi:hypothetical protein